MHISDRQLAVLTNAALISSNLLEKAAYENVDVEFLETLDTLTSIFSGLAKEIKANSNAATKQ